MSLIKKFLFGKKVSPSLIRLLVLSLILLFISSFVYYTAKVDGESMNPTLEEGQVLFVDKDAYQNYQPQRYDIVVFTIRDGKQTDTLIKRIIGLPTETIFIKNGEIFINQKKFKIVYGNGLINKGAAGIGPILIPENSYFVIGDNRHDTYFGIIRKKDIIGKVIY